MARFKEFYQTLIAESPDNFRTEEGEFVNYDSDPNNVTFTIYNGRIFWGATRMGVMHTDISQEILRGSEEVFRDNKVKAWPKPLSEDERTRLNKIIQLKREEKLLNVRTYDDLFVAGRYFPKYGIMSFWNRRPIVEKQLALVKAFFSHAGVDLDTIKIETVEKKNFFLDVDGVTLKASNDNDAPERSEEEVRELMARQHFDPNAKKELRRRAGPPPKSKLPFGWNVFSRLSESFEIEDSEPPKL